MTAVSDGVTQMVDDLLRDEGYTQIDGPPYAYFSNPQGIRFDYQSLSERGFCSMVHAEKRMSAALAGYLRKPEHKVDGLTMIVWRTRPIIEQDEFGLWGYCARFVAAPPDLWKHTTPYEQPSSGFEVP